MLGSHQADSRELLGSATVDGCCYRSPVPVRSCNKRVPASSSVSSGNVVAWPVVPSKRPKKQGCQPVKVDHRLNVKPFRTFERSKAKEAQALEKQRALRDLLSERYRDAWSGMETAAYDALGAVYGASSTTSPCLSTDIPTRARGDCQAGGGACAVF